MDLEATVDKAVALIAQAAGQGASLIAFPETWIPTYPLWIFGAAGWADPVAARVYARMHRNSLMLRSAPMQRLCEAARKAKAVVVMGATEKLSEDAGSLYNSQFFIGDDGEVLGVHRKVMPTYTERNVWAYGDGSTLSVFETRVGRIGGLICWEHWMPLARFAMHALHEAVHVAAWPDLPEVHQMASRHYAFEGKCFVICVGSYMTLEHIPRDFELYDRIADTGTGGSAPSELLPGGSGIIGPDGSWISGPVAGREEIVYGEIDLGRVLEERLLLDTVGHYNRPDIFELTVNRQPMPHVRWVGDEPLRPAKPVSVKLPPDQLWPPLPDNS